MNKKAELFNEYLKKNKIDVFTQEELKDDQINTVVFRSRLDVEGNMLPMMVALDDSIYAIIRVQVASKVLHDDNESAVQKLLNEYNRQYKIFKYYITENGDLVLDTCLAFRQDELDAELLYSMFDVLIHHLTESYKPLMKAIWA